MLSTKVSEKRDLDKNTSNDQTCSEKVPEQAVTDKRSKIWEEHDFSSSPRQTLMTCRFSFFSRRDYKICHSVKVRALNLHKLSCRVTKRGSFFSLFRWLHGLTGRRSPRFCILQACFPFAETLIPFSLPTRLFHHHTCAVLYYQIFLANSQSRHFFKETY